jgi:serine/threonine protein kinase
MTAPTLPFALHEEPELKHLKALEVVAQRRGTQLIKVTDGTATYALKVADESTREQGKADQVAAEGIILARYPDLCPKLLVKQGSIRKVSWLLLKWIKGKSARDVRQQMWQSDLQFNLKIFKLIIKALKPAHKLGILHGDLQAAHFVGFPQTCRLIDWGMALGIQEQKYTGGLSHYMAPEIAAQILETGFAQYDVTAEIYSLAAVFFVMCTGHAPIFYGPLGIDAPEKTKLNAIAQCTRASIDIMPQNNLTSLMKIIEKGLNKNPTKRFQSLVEFETSLEALSFKND